MISQTLKAHTKDLGGGVEVRRLLPAATLPVKQWPNAELRLIAGTGWGLQAPVKTFSPMFYGAITSSGTAQFELPPEHTERAIYVVDGAVSVDGITIAAHTVAAFEPGAPVAVSTTSAARIMAFGDAAMDGDRFISWNFVASSKELIEDARSLWREQRFPGVPGETEFIPLPER